MPRRRKPDSLIKRFNSSSVVIRLSVMRLCDCDESALARLEQAAIASADQQHATPR